MDANGWAVVIAAVFLGLQQLLQMYLSYIRDTSVGKKVDQNTNITKAAAVAATIVAADATKAATIVAKDATTAAEKVSAKADEIANALNGSFDERLHKIVDSHTEPILSALNKHTEQDEQNMIEIRQAIALQASKK